MCKVTIFTPTYNRRYILHELYNSLKRQTKKDFEWLIVDDGSSDNTIDLVNKWIEEKNMNIRYYYVKNGGKQRAINYGLDKAYGELFLVVDSDDYLSDDAIEKIIVWEKEIPKRGYCGFAGNWATKEGKILNPVFKKNYVDCSFLDRYPRKENNYFFIGHDRAWVFYTNVHKKYKYPIFEDEKFIAEAVVWNRMANDGYKLRCYNDVIYYFEHQDDGLTNNIQFLFLKNPHGYALWKIEMEQFLTNSFFYRVKMRYSLFCDMKSKYGIKEISKYTNTSLYLYVIFIIISKIFSLKKFIKVEKR